MSLPYVFTGYAPNETAREVRTAVTWLTNPRRWQEWRRDNGTAAHVAAVEIWLQKFYNLPEAGAVAVDSGRSGLLLLLQSLGIGAGDEVLVQAYTCVVVINAIRWAGATPVFVDITERFTMDPESAARQITPRTKAILIQHTFGYSADLKALLPLAATHHLTVIEDAAQALGGRKNGRLLGTFGHAAIVSFGTDKIVSAVRGGAILTSDLELAKKIRSRVAVLPTMPLSYLIPHVLRVPLFYFGKKWFASGVGKWLLAGAKRLGLTNQIIYPGEKRGEHMRPFPTRFPNILAALLLPQLVELESGTHCRRQQAARYFLQIKNPAVRLPPPDTEALFLRFPILVQNPAAWHQAASQAHIQLGDWYNTVVAPKNISPTAAAYTPGLCPQAEALAARTLNLPTGPNINAATQARVIAFVNSFSP